MRRLREALSGLGAVAIGCLVTGIVLLGIAAVATLAGASVMRDLALVVFLAVVFGVLILGRSSLGTQALQGAKRGAAAALRRVPTREDLSQAVGQLGERSERNERMLEDSQARLDDLSRQVERVLVAVVKSAETASRLDDTVIPRVDLQAVTITRRVPDLVAKRIAPEIDALMQLNRMLVRDEMAPFPLLGGFAMLPTGVLHAVEVIMQQKPATVLELGSGSSTVWLGYAVRGYGGQVISLDHDPEYLAETQAWLRLHGLTDLVDLRFAPLEGLEIEGEDYLWYQQRALEDVHDIGLLVVDGPPGDTCRLARLPAVPLLRPRLRDDVTVILDDADRPEEREIIASWVQAGLHEVRHSSGTSSLALDEIGGGQ